VELSIIHQDKDYVAINKPAGLLVHRTALAAAEDQFALQILRDQLGQEVFPCHRLDRPTSGVLLFALNKPALTHAQEQFQHQQTEKQYWAVVRGWAPENGHIDYELRSEESPDKVQSAQTDFKRLAISEIDRPSGRYASTRVSLVELSPKTGRKHQLRRHLAHLRHPILGDTRHGDGAQNRFLRDFTGTQRLLLHACELSLQGIRGQQLQLRAAMDTEFERLLCQLQLNCSNRHSGAS